MIETHKETVECPGQADHVHLRVIHRIIAQFLVVNWHKTPPLTWFTHAQKNQKIEEAYQFLLQFCEILVFVVILVNVVITCGRN